MSIILKAENISKQYRLGKVGTGTISDDLKRWWYTVRGLEDPFLIVGGINDRGAKAMEDYVWALRDINFEVNTGEVLGIIGKNGAGKSTLLKILSRVTSPSTGSIKTKGRIASLLEVGTGFHGELTGRENIFMNGAVLGMTKSEIKRKLDEIIDFSGCEMYIDTPVKRYSSGMTVRLGFAVAAHLEPEILVVDEVLAVGDADFQKKAIGKMQDLSTGEGRTVLFVSHNMASIKNLCTRGVLLENGVITTEGDIGKVLNKYLVTESTEIFWEGTDGDDTMKLLKVEIYNKSRSNRFKNTDELSVILEFKIGKYFNDIVIGVSIRSGLGNPIVGMIYNDFNKHSKISPGKYRVIFKIPSKTLATGNYQLHFNLSIPFVKKFTTDKSKLMFSIDSNNEIGNKFFLENNMNFNSVIRPNWFDCITKID